MSVAKVALACAAVVAVAAALRHDQSHDPQGYVYHEHSLTRPYMDNGMDIPNWDYGGSAVVTANYIRLTPDRQSRRGYLWNQHAWNPVSTDDYPDWEMTVEFKVFGQGKRLFGDGFALWYTQDKQIEGPVFGNKNKFNGMGIFFDTYSNVQQGHQQYISVMIGDGKTDYDHDADGGSAKIAGCPRRFRGRDEDHPFFARVVYQYKLLRTYVDTGSGWEECFVLRRVYLPRGYYFGVTAATGELADNHDIISVRISDPAPLSVDEKKDLERRIAEDIKNEVKDDPSVDPQYEQVSPSSSGGSSWLLYVGVVTLLGLAVAGAAYFYVSSRQSSVHFT